MALFCKYTFCEYQSYCVGYRVTGLSIDIFQKEFIESSDRRYPSTLTISRR
uniref:AlNc14C62G4516 protein n=1 Tax=Albugo laibachii Nc14 TaxID=890382 RepID=F0WCZ2_9STRA|nr:AlNc14C62G4516 [Albugo laibachii Nc14]|eukprot:CCA19063.1 AlNc14C62G4516 [Albugo laibachii Nc14]